MVSKQVKLDKLPFLSIMFLERPKRVKFIRSENGVKDKLTYVHFDLWDPVQNSSLSDSKYFVSFIVDFSKKIVYPLKSKDQTHERVKGMEDTSWIAIR